MLEAKDRIGGAIWTDRADGFTLEGGADSFITNKPWAVDLCRERLGHGRPARRHRRPAPAVFRGSLKVGSCRCPKGLCCWP